MRTVIGCGLVLVAMATGGCGSKGDEQNRAGGGAGKTSKTPAAAGAADTGAAPGTGVAPGTDVPPATLTLEPFELTTTDGLVITARVPAGWKSSDFGGGKLLNDPDGGLYASLVMLGPDCSGDCATIGANLQKLPESVIETQKAAGYTEVEILRQSELPGGGVDLAIRIARHGDPASSIYQYIRALYGEGWPSAVKCTAVAAGKRIAVRETLAEVCTSVAVARK